MRSGWCLGRRGGPGAAWGCFRRVGEKNWGSIPRPCAAGVLSGQGRRPRCSAPPRGTPSAFREQALEDRNSGAGGATRWDASAFLPWRSMSVHRVDLRLNRGRERESSGACAGSAIHADAVGALLHRVRHRGHCARRVVGWAARARTGHRQRARRPRTSDLGAQGPQRRPGRTRAPQRPRIQVTRPVAHGPRGSPKTEPRASTGAVGSSYAGATAEVLIKPPRTPDPSWRHGPWKGCADLGNRDRHLGQLAPNAPACPHPTNDDDLPPTAAEHRYNHNHTTTV